MRCSGLDMDDWAGVDRVLQGVGHLARRLGMQFHQGLSLRDDISQAQLQVDTRRFSLRGAGEFGQPG